jgi:cyclic pyranopterin phosphate synthase
MTESFCATCNRVRVGPDGTLRACLGGREDVPLRDLLAPGAPWAALEQRIRGALLAKAPEHDLGTRTAAAPSPSMASIGG